jgi:hypothetical protein
MSRPMNDIEFPIRIRLAFLELLTAFQVGEVGAVT